MEYSLNVLSFDPNRVKFKVLKEKGIIIVEKRTFLVEYQQINNAHEYLKKYPISLKKYDINVIPVTTLDWKEKESTLITEYYEGINVEFILRKRDKNFLIWIDVIKEIFKEIRLTGFLWGDFAPRNMIFNEQYNCIKLVDFERNLILKNGIVDNDLFVRYIKNYSREEFACFLLEKEQNILFKDFFIVEKNKNINIFEIYSKRKRKLLESIYGVKQEYNITEIQKIEEIMIFIATPFEINDNVFYPMDLIDKITTKGGIDEYVRIAQSLYGFDERKRYHKLQQIKESFQ